MTTSKRSVDFELSNAVAEEVRALANRINKTPNPAPLGLFAFGLTTALLQLKHTRIAGEGADDFQGIETLVLGYAMFFGGLLQVIAGLSEIKRNNIFGYTAFLMYGGFWMSLSLVEIVTLIATGEEPPPVSEKALQTLFVLVGLYTSVLFICTLKMNKVRCTLSILNELQLIVSI